MNYLTDNFESFIDKSLVQGIVVSLFFYIIGFIRGASYGFFVIPRLRRLKAILLGRKYVLIWNDHSIQTSEKLIALLKAKNPKYRFKALNTGESLLQYPISKDATHLILLIVSDVTKLSDIESRRIKIQKKLVKFVSSGGIIFGTHDLIYRRCRNKLLEEIYGCEICNFQRVYQPVPVKIDPKQADHPLLTGLPENFELDDNEVCWGEWSKDAKILIRTNEKFRNTIQNKLEYVPTLVVKHTGNMGTLIWLNCADKTDKLASSLSGPQPEVVRIISNAINLHKEIKEHYLANH